MTETEEILYRKNPGKKFIKYVYIGTAYPEDMYNSPLHFETLEDLNDFVEDDNIAEILVSLAFSLMIYNQSSEEFEDLFGEELFAFFDEKGSYIEDAVDAWFWSLEAPVFQGLDLREQKIKESDFFSNGELKSIEFTDGSEVKILNENSGYGGGYYVEKDEYPQLLKDIKDLRQIIGGSV